MVRLWAIFLANAVGVLFKLFDPKEVVYLPLGNDYQHIPKDVFYYHIFEHVGQIILAGVMLSFMIWPANTRHRFAYVVYFCIEVVDLILYRIYYRGWFWQDVPWNVVKTCIFGLVVFRYQTMRDNGARHL